jgi:hypothetical protein
MAAAVDVNNPTGEPTGEAGLIAIDKRGSRAPFLHPRTYELLASPRAAGAPARGRDLGDHPQLPED